MSRSGVRTTRRNRRVAGRSTSTVRRARAVIGPALVAACLSTIVLTAPTPTHSPGAGVSAVAVEHAAGTPATATAAKARGPRRSAGVVLDAPEQVSAVLVRLTGRAPGARVAVLQLRLGARWLTLQRIPVRQGRFTTTVVPAQELQRVRVVAAGRRSVVRSVPRGLVLSEPAPGDDVTPVPPLPPVDLPPVDLPPVELPGLPPVDVPVVDVPTIDPNLVDDCGLRPAKANGELWSCTFADDFDGTRLDRSKWLPQTVFVTGERAGRYACYLDDENNISVSGGALHLTVREVEVPATCALPGWDPSRYTAGMVSTYRLFSQTHGRFEARIKNTATSAPGLQEAFWLWPDDRQDIPVLWPEAGEIDIMETYSQFPDLAIPFLHYTANDNGGPIPGLNTAWNCAAQRGAYTTYTLDWSAERLAILVNGRTCLVNTSGDAAFNRAYIIGLTQALGLGSNAHTGSAPLPATMSIDYVRVWK